MKPSTTTHVVDYDGCVIVIKNVPCEECQQCGEIEYSDDIMKHLDNIINNVKKLMQDVSVIDYTKIA